MKKLHKGDSETVRASLRSSASSVCPPPGDSPIDVPMDWDDVDQWHSTPIQSGKTYSKKNVQSVSTIQEDTEDAYTYVSTYTEASGDTSCESVEVAREHRGSYREIGHAISPPLLPKYDQTKETSSESVEIVFLLPQKSDQEERERTPPSLILHAGKPKTVVKEGRRKSLTETESASSKTGNTLVRKTRHTGLFHSKRSSLTSLGSSPDTLPGKFEQQLSFGSRLTSTPTKKTRGHLDCCWTNMSPIERVSADSVEELVPHVSQGIVCSEEIHVDTPEDEAKRVPQTPRDKILLKMKENEARSARKKATVSNETKTRGYEVACDLVKHGPNVDIEIPAETRETDVQKSKDSGRQLADSKQPGGRGRSSNFDKKKGHSPASEVGMQNSKRGYSLLPERMKKDTVLQEMIERCCEEGSDSSIEIVEEHVQQSLVKTSHGRRQSKENKSSDHSDLTSGKTQTKSSKSRREPTKRKIDLKSMNKKVGNKWKKSKKLKKEPQECTPCFIERYVRFDRNIKQNLKIWKVKLDTHGLPYRKWAKTVPQDILEVF